MKILALIALAALAGCERTPQQRKERLVADCVERDSYASPDPIACAEMANMTIPAGAK